jgi:CRISPR-associated protein Cas2
MSKQNNFTVITYDVSDSRRRRALVRVLESFGERVQGSVFEAWLTDIECKKLERLATACLKNAEDKLAIYVLPRADYLDIVSLGMGEITQDFTWRLI